MKIRNRSFGVKSRAAAIAGASAAGVLSLIVLPQQAVARGVSQGVGASDGARDGDAADPEAIDSEAIDSESESTTDAASAKESTLRDVSITFSPLHLVMPVFEVTGEFRLSPRFSLAGILGAGSIEVKSSDASGITTDNFTAFEVGAQGRVYAIGDFDHGMQLGIEALFVHISIPSSARVSGSGQGLAVGPFLGYKVSAAVGFTFDAQLGFQFIAAEAEAESGDQTASASDSGVIPLLNLNVGWAF